jgi:hypothetical protein
MADNDLEEQVTCWVCFEVMEDPTTLACSHSFCKDCLIKVYKRDPNCPFCRRPFGLPLPDPNRDILELIERIKGPKAASSNPDPRVEIEQDSPLLNLPVEVTSHIFDFLEPKQLVGTGLVCHGLHDLADDPWVWKTLCLEAFPFVGGNVDGNDWKRIYLRRSRLRKGWEGGKSGDFSVTSMRGHDGYITSVDILKNQAITGGSTGQIKVWRTTTSKLSYECIGHASMVNTVKFNDIYIFSGSQDRTVKLWDTQTGSLLRSMDSEMPVSSLSFNADHVLSCANTIVDMHDIRSAQRTMHQRTTVQSNKAIFLENGHIAIARTSSVGIYDPAGNVDVAVHTYAQGATHMEYAGNDMLALASGQNIVLFNYKTGATVWTCRRPTGSDVTVFRADSTRIVCGMQDGNVLVVRHRNAAVKQFEAHQGGVNDLQFDAQRIVSAGADNSIKVWDIQTGNMLYTLLGGSLQLRGAAKAHPTKPGCSNLVYDENRIVGSFANILKSFNFSND